MTGETEMELERTDRAVAEEDPQQAERRAFLRRRPPFDRMKPEDVDFLVARLRPIAFAAGDVVTDPEAGPAEWFYVLHDGRIGGYRPDGARAGWRVSPGECFPLGALAANRPVSSVRKAETDVVCLTMDRAAFDALRGRSEAFAAFCASGVSGLLERVSRQVQAEAVRDLGADDSLNVPISERRLAPPVTARPDSTIAEALAAMSVRRVGSVVVVDPAERPIGIFTLKDLMDRVALAGRPLDGPIAGVMTPDPICLPRGAFAFEAAMAMAHAGIHHVCVADEGRLVGVLSERDLFSMQRVGLVNLSKSIGRAGSTQELARIGADMRQLVAQMMAQGVKVGQIAQMITLLNDQIVERTLELAIAEAGGPPPIDFVWIAFGSEGRKEQTLKTDQDNGILFDPPEGMSPDEARAILLPLAARCNAALAEAGFPLCPGEIMARNPECCLSGREWRARFQRWIASSTPENLLRASIFFDFRAVRGDAAPLEALRSWLLDLVADNGLFRRQMAANALRNGPPLGVFRDFKLSGAGADANTIDLKLNGVTPFVDAARILALGKKVGATNTVARLSGAAAAGAMDESDAAAWIDAYDYVRMLRMRLNEEQAAEDRPLTNRIDPAKLNDLDRRILKESFREARRLQARLQVEYQL